MFVIYFDLETGGVEPQHPTIQLAAIAVENGVEVGAFEMKLKFDEAAADPEALKINHYDREAWKGAPTPSVAIGRFEDWMRPYRSVTLTSKRTGKPYTVARLAGYNALTFDLPRLKALFYGQFFPCEYLVRDVLQRALFYFDEHPEKEKPENFRLTTVAAYFGLEVNGAHNALADARLSAALAKALRETK